MTEADLPPYRRPHGARRCCGYVEADPPNPTLTMTADAAEISAIRLLDAADKAREG